MDNIINGLLHETTASLAEYLNKILPELSENWWRDKALNVLSFKQQQRVEQQGIDSLSSLDLAALLRVLDQNWYQISIKMNLSSDARHFAKEMQTIRNRWAHASSEGFADEDVYRDLDTLQRFGIVIEANDGLIQKIRSAKKSLLPREKISSPKEKIKVDRITQAKEPVEIEFNAGQIVFLKSNPDTRGAIVSVTQGKPENRYQVFINGETQTFYASQLQTEERKDRDSLFLPCRQFQSYLTALQIRYPGL